MKVSHYSLKFWERGYSNYTKNADGKRTKNVDKHI